MKLESKYSMGDNVKFYIHDPEIQFQGQIVAIHFYIDKQQERYNIQMSNAYIYEGVDISNIIKVIQ